MNYLLPCFLSLLSLSCEKKELNNESAPIAIDFTVTNVDDQMVLNWETAEAVDIWRAIEEQEFENIASTVNGSSYTDPTKELADNTQLAYRIVTKGGYIHHPVVREKEQKIRVSKLTESALLDIVQKTTLKYFYDFAHPTCKLSRERSNNPQDLDVVTTGGTGFGVMALIAGAERNFITRAQAYSHIREITNFLQRIKRFHGVYAHWYFGSTGIVKPFSEKDNGGDLLETALLMQGMLTAKEYFSTPASTQEEQALAKDIDNIWRAIEWNFYERGENRLTWHWSEQYGFEMNMGISGWNEGLIAYVLAGASPTYPISRDTYVKGYTHNGNIKNGKNYYGITLPLGNDSEMGGPLFFAHYSFLGLDPRGLKDHCCDNYFEQNKSHVLINRAYCIENPKKHKGYSENFWGLTASDCPANEWHYLAHAPGGNDNGTISPTAALSSMPYAPQECMKVLKYLYGEMNARAWGEYGFYDAINFNVPFSEQVYKSYIGIDQGPIIIMIENYRSGLLWNLFMGNKEIRKGLETLGFTSPAIQ